MTLGSPLATLEPMLVIARPGNTVKILLSIRVQELVAAKRAHQPATVFFGRFAAATKWIIQMSAKRTGPGKIYDTRVDVIVVISAALIMNHVRLARQQLKPSLTSAYQQA